MGKITLVIDLIYRVIGIFRQIPARPVKWSQKILTLNVLYFG